MKPESVNCPYCQAPTKFLETTEALYHGRDYGPAYVCWPCDAWVGCHPGTFKPLGRLANAELRKAKIAAHAAFDVVWRARLARKQAEDPRYRKGMARGGRYKKLAELLGIPREECHIGLFDVDLCRRTVDLCRAKALD